MIVGTSVPSNLDRVKTFRPRHAPKMLRELERMRCSNIFQSLEVDVFHEGVTTAHGYRGQGRMPYEQVLDLSLRANESRTLRGINIAGYAPRLEGPPYKTANLLSDYLGRMVINWK